MKDVRLGEKTVQRTMHCKKTAEAMKGNVSSVCREYQYKFPKESGGKERHYKLTKAARQFFTGPGQPLGAFDKEYRVRAREHAITERLQPNSFLLIMLCISLKVVWALN